MTHIHDYADMPAPGAWIAEASCRGERIDLFFESTSVPRRVRAICESCPVRRECLSYALDNDVHGVWAGTSWDQRKRMRRRVA